MNLWMAVLVNILVFVFAVLGAMFVESMLYGPAGLGAILGAGSWVLCLICVDWTRKI